ncbi:unnamed protein product, partial [Scytosiphon promiscuus]
ATEQKEDATPGGGREGTRTKAMDAAGGDARPVLAEKAPTRAAGVNTEEAWVSTSAESDRLKRLEADVRRWRETCTRTDAQLREERSFGQETAQRLAEKERAVRQLTERLQEMQAAANPSVVARAKSGNLSSTGVRQRHGQLSCEQPAEDARRKTDNGSSDSDDSDGDIRAEDDDHTSRGPRRRGNHVGGSSTTAGAEAAASPAA